MLELENWFNHEKKNNGLVDIKFFNSDTSAEVVANAIYWALTTDTYDLTSEEF